MTALLGLALLAGVAVIAFVAGRTSAATAARPTSEELLARRFARGEIDEQEYRTRRDTLAGLPADPADR